MTDEDFEESELSERICLPVHFGSLAEMESVYRADIRRGGIFVATPEPPALRDLVEVEFRLDEWPEALRVEGEVVRRETGEGTQGPGVAVAFTQPMAELRVAFQSRLESRGESEPSPLPTEALFAVESGWEGDPLLSQDPLGVSLLELAASGFSLARMLEVIPESENEIRLRLDALLESGVLTCE
ncbi:MAG: PilZ domain-containing protein [Myxococcota bacterium]|nr:PilZ domain-containing protein [Myxococcota bacterium]